MHKDALFVRKTEALNVSVIFSRCIKKHGICYMMFVKSYQHPKRRGHPSVLIN